MNLWKKSFLIILVIVIMFTLFACYKETSKPDISITAEITKITEQQFQKIGTSGIENPSKEDFKEFKFQLDVKHSNNVINRNIIVPDFKNVFEDYKKDIYWFGNLSLQDNRNENFAKYSYDITLNTRGLDENALIEILNSQEVVITWLTEDGQQKESKYKLGELVQFK